MYKVYDLETENHTRHRRFASPFIKENWVVMRGWKNQGDAKCSYSYHPKPDGTHLEIEENITMLVGHNLKFDLLYEWHSPDMKAFLKRGGRIWDTQYAEYLLGAAQQNVQMNSMDQIIEKYGGRKKIDAVKALWEAGYLTSQIDPDMLRDYLIGTEEEGQNSGDVGNTELIFLGQIKKAKELGMLPMIQARMDGLLCTTEMEYNGLKIDVVEAKRRMDILNAELDAAVKELEEYIPPLPPECEFKWGSTRHVSCLIFGGAIKYKKQDTYIDEKTGELARFKAKESWPLFDGEPQNPKELEFDDDKQLYKSGSKWQDVFVSGKKKGTGKTKNVDVPGDLKVKWQNFVVDLDGYTHPKPEWESALLDGRGEPTYSTAADIIEELGLRDLPFLKALANRQSIAKDLKTYYLANDPKKGWVGMLTCVMPESHMIHHGLNHTSTVTTRLSSSNPNLQNIPRADKSEVKKMFISRFKGGLMLEIDYSQLEVVVQGVLSGDPQLCEDLRNRVDFHCKRVSAKFNIPYEEALYRCKNEDYEDYQIWKGHRTKCKEFSFQRAYGAGAPKIAATTGMTVEDVQSLIEVEETLYPGVVHFNQAVAREVAETAKPFRDHETGKIYRRGYYKAPTGTLYGFRTYDSMDYMKKRGVDDSFMPTELKNYPVQGTGGEIVQIILGKLFRHFIATDNYGGRALLCNTVHDCVWADTEAEVTHEVAADMTRIMESVPEVLHELYGMDVTVPFPVEAEIGPNMYDLHGIH